MLYLETGLELHGLTLYQDYNNKSLFFYLPKSPRLATEAGQPMFQLLIYRDANASAAAINAGGFLTMTTDLGVPAGVLQRVRDDLSRLYSVQARLAPVPIKSGSVRVTALDSASAGQVAPGELRFVENLISSSSPSLYGDQRAAFSAELSQQGAALMKAALEKEGATPVVLLYDLVYEGLHPAYDVTITIQFRQAYEHLRNRTQMNTLWFRTDLDSELESLIKSGAIKIEEVVYETETPEDTAARMTRLHNLAKELAQWTFFKPALNPGTVLASDRGTLTAYDARPDLNSILAGLTSTSRAALTGVGAQADVGTPRRPGAAVATGAVEGEAQNGDAETPTSPPASGTSEPPTAVEAWNRAGRPQGAFMLRNLEQEERQEIKYELRQVAAVERAIAPQGQIRLLEGSASLPGRILEVDLRDKFFDTLEGTVSTAAELAAAGVNSMVVKLRYGTNPDGTRWKDVFEAPLTAAGQSHSYRFFVDHLGSREIEYQVVLNYRPDFAIGNPATVETSPWQPTTTRNLDINPSTFSAILPVSLEAAMVDWNAVQQIQAQVQYEDAESGLTASDTKILTRSAPTASVPIRPKNPAHKEVTVTATFFYTDGESETVTLKQAGDRPFVINQPSDLTKVVDIQLADLLNRYRQMIVQLAHSTADSPEVDRTIILSEGTTTGQWSFRRQPAEGAQFAYRYTGFLKNGAVRAAEQWVKTDNPLVIVGDRAAGLLAVEVAFLGPLAEGDFRLAKLKLTYPDAPTWADNSVETLFRTGLEPFTWRVPMARPEATAYTYEVTWFSHDGQRLAVGPITTHDEILLLDPLAPQTHATP